MITLAIDPGHAGEGCACAVYADGTLRAAWFERYAGRVLGSPAWLRIDEVVVERPAYQGARSDQARVADLINLAWSGALLAGAYAGRDGAWLVEYTPNDVRDKRCPKHARVSTRPAPCTCSRGWKGSEQKPVQHARLWEVLTPAERAVLGGDATARRIDAAVTKGALERWAKPGAAYYGAWTGHNTLDAAALGAHHLGRLERR